MEKGNIDQWYIKEGDKISTEFLNYLSRALKHKQAPIVIFATNRGICEIRGTQKERKIGSTHVLKKVCLLKA